MSHQHDDMLKSYVAAMVLLSTSLAFAGEPLCIVSLTGERQLAVYTISETGKLSLENVVDIESKPGTTRFDAIGRHVYVGGADPNAITVFRVEPDKLTHLQTVEAPAKPSYLQVTPSGRFLIASYYMSGQITVHRIVGEGRLSKEPLQILNTDPRAHGVAVDRTGQFVFIPHTSPNRISQFRMNVKTGHLTASSPAGLQRAEGVGPRHLLFHPVKSLAVGSNEQGRSISTYRLDRETGLLRELDTQTSMPDNVEDKANTSHVEFHPTGRFAYIANRGHGSLATFEVKRRSGKLALIQRVPTEPVVRSFSLSPDGRHLVAAGQTSNRLRCYSIADDGKLTQSHCIDSGKTPWWVAFSPTAGTPNSTQNIDYGSLNRSLSLGQRAMSGEVTLTSALVQTRLTRGAELAEFGDLPGSPGFLGSYL